MTIAATRPSRAQEPVKETLFRGGRAPVGDDQVSVSRDGGNAQAGMLSGVSLIARGEALGHEMWIDEETLAQVEQLANRGKHGVKSRFTHPSMSADGMGRHLGRIHNVRTDEQGRTVGDLHFAEAAHDTPDGDLAGYVMSLAEEDPHAAGLSIVFEHDMQSENEFMLANGAVIKEGYIVGFASPDPENVNNYPHVRLKELRAADVVDEPAANPEGLFDRQTLPRDVDSLLSYAAGLTEDKPNCRAFGVDADRASQFVGRWLKSHGLSLKPETEEKPMSTTQADAVTETPADPQPNREELFEQFKTTQQKYVDRFGAEDGVRWFNEGKDYAEALELFADKQAEQNAKLREDLAAAEAKLAAVDLGEENPIETGAGETETARFSDFFKSSSN